MFAFGIITNRVVKDKLVPIICIVSPVLCWFYSYFSKDLVGEFALGSELLVINGSLVFLGMLIISKKGKGQPKMRSSS